MFALPELLLLAELFLLKVDGVLGVVRLDLDWARVNAALERDVVWTFEPVDEVFDELLTCVAVDFDFFASLFIPDIPAFFCGSLTPFTAMETHLESLCWNSRLTYMEVAEEMKKVAGEPKGARSFLVFLVIFSGRKHKAFRGFLAFCGAPSPIRGVQDQFALSTVRGIALGRLWGGGKHLKLGLFSLGFSIGPLDSSIQVLRAACL